MSLKILEKCVHMNRSALHLGLLSVAVLNEVCTNEPLTNYTGQ